MTDRNEVIGIALEMPVLLDSHLVTVIENVIGFIEKLRKGSNDELIHQAHVEIQTVRQGHQVLH